MIISNSNIMSMQKCERQFLYSVIYNLRPKTYPTPMEVGTFGHTMMEAGLLVLKDGGSYDEASEAVSEEVNKLLATKGITELTLAQSKVLRHVLAFLAYFIQQPWEIVEVERRLEFEVDEKLIFGFTPDLVCRWTTGPKKGILFILDWKFVGQYWNKRKLDLWQQGPKYVRYRNLLHPEQKVGYAAAVMFNTRAEKNATGNALFLVKWIDLNKTKLDTIQAENESLMLDVVKAMNLGEAFAERARRTTDNNTCNLCFFADDLCPADLSGRATDKIIKLNYIQNDYGYN